MAELRDPDLLSPGTKKTAKIISFVAQAPFLAIPVFILLNLSMDDLTDMIVADLVCILFATIIPIIMIGIYSKKLKSKDFDIPNKEDRTGPFIIGVVSYALGSVALCFIEVPEITWVLMVCYVANTFVAMLITRYWKISIHALGVVGPTLSLYYAFGPIGALFALILIPVVWSRYVLGKHTPAQLGCGILLGLVLTSALFYILL